MSVQPISPTSIVSRIWEIYRDQRRVLLGTAFGLYAIEFVLNLLLSTTASLALSILFWVLSVLYQGMVVKLVQDMQDRRREHSIADLARSVEPVFWQLGAVSILFGIAVAVGFAVLIVPGVIVMVIWAVVAPVTVLERPGVYAAFRRSRELVRGNEWNVLEVIALVFLAVILVSAAAGVIAGPLGSVGRALIQWAVNAAVAPIAALSASVLYFALPHERHTTTAAATTTTTITTTTHHGPASLRRRTARQSVAPAFSPVAAVEDSVVEEPQPATRHPAS
jgi:hypothetical protein